MYGKISCHFSVTYTCIQHVNTVEALYSEHLQTLRVAKVICIQMLVQYSSSLTHRIIVFYRSFLNLKLSVEYLLYVTSAVLYALHVDARRGWVSYTRRALAMWLLCKVLSVVSYVSWCDLLVT